MAYPDGVVAYNPVTVCQYALGLHQLWCDTGTDGYRQRFVQQVAWLITARHAVPQGGAVWLYDFDYPAYGAKAPWTSGLAQAQALSVLLRAWGLGVDGAGAEVIQEALAPMMRGVGSGGFQGTDRSGCLWWLEYPTDPTSGVLNGHMFAVLTMLEVGEFLDHNVLAVAEQGVQTVKAMLPEFDTGRWIRYDRRYRRLCSEHYLHHVYLPLIAALHEATRDPVFERYLHRWRRYSQWPYPQVYRLERRVRHVAAAIGRRINLVWRPRSQDS